MYCEQRGTGTVSSLHTKLMAGEDGSWITDGTAGALSRPFPCFGAIHPSSQPALASFPVSQRLCHHGFAAPLKILYNLILEPHPASIQAGPDPLLYN